MDAISDVSRASQIKSHCPPRPPLANPINLDELFGFNDALRRKSLDLEILYSKYSGQNTIFINQVDSYIGKYIVSVLIQKPTEDPIQQEVVIDSEINEDELSVIETSKTTKSKKEKKKNRETETKSEGKSRKTRKAKNSGKTSDLLTETQTLSKPQEPLISAFEESIEDIEDIIYQETPKYDCTRLTVAEYYEMLELERGVERDEFIKEKLGKYVSEKETADATQVDPEVALKEFCKIEQMENKACDIEIVGTLQNNQFSENYIQEGVTEIIEVSQENTDFLSKIVKCGAIIYNINEEEAQVAEATWVLNSLLKYIDKEKENELNKNCFPLFILISSFMTWGLTKPLNPEEPELPFTEKDYRKRKPHPNYQSHYELEELVIKTKFSGNLETVILVCGIPYGHEEHVLSYYFEMAYNCFVLPVYGSGNNLVPLVHVENIGQIIKKVLQKRYSISLPFIFAKDPLSCTMKDIVKAVTNSFGSGCYRTIPDRFAFLNDAITQDIYDQITTNISLESCYHLFNEGDIKWIYETGFVESVVNVVKEYINAMKLKPVRFIFYSFSNSEMKDLPMNLSKYYHVPYISIDDIVKEYINEMQEKLKQLEKDELEVQKTNLNGDKLFTSGSIQKLEECQDEHLQNSLEFFKTLKLNSNSYGQTLTESQKIIILKERLKKRCCLNVGYVLDGFPQTLQQAELTFLENDGCTLEHDLLTGVSILPDYVIDLNKLQAPSLKSATNETDSKNYEEELFYNDNKTKDKHSIPLGDVEQLTDPSVKEENKDYVTDIAIEHVPESTREINTEVINFFIENNDTCKLVRMEANTCDNCNKVFEQILQAIEKTNSSDDLKSFRCSKLHHEASFSQDLEHQKTQSWNEEDKMSGHVDKELRASSQGPEYNKMKELEELTLAMRSRPLLKYLINCVYPTLTNAILEVTAQRPEDPLDFLAEYLFKNNPDGRMVDPSEAQLKEKMMNQELGFPNVDSKACLV